LGETDVVDLCERCGASLGAAISGMFRLQNVSTRRREKISADEEDRLRMGYEIKTGFRFPERDGKPSYRTATARKDGATVATLFYGNAATLWRVNFGWTRRKRGEQGFLLDMERGYWGKGPDGDAPDNEDGMSPLVARVIPFVEDRRNCLIFRPEAILEDHQMGSLQSALRNAVQVRFQLEENGLAAEPLPSFMDRRMILFYESAEGGAGVLRRLLDDGRTLAGVAEEALRICHFDPETGLDIGGPPREAEKCEAACYDCIMNYGNQKDHGALDRHSIRDYLLELAGSALEASPGEKPRGEHLADLMKRCDSELERAWLRFVDERGLNLPTHAQYLIRPCETRVDFFYDLGAEKVAVFVDGPVHDDSGRRERDRAVAGCLEDLGVVVVRFGWEKNWKEVIRVYSNIFGF
jgi:very-short-patch-repair endonuclease